eukprot:2785665-Rhodomonas_salina.4
MPGTDLAGALVPGGMRCGRYLNLNSITELLLEWSQISPIARYHCPRLRSVIPRAVTVESVPCTQSWYNGCTTIICTANTIVLYQGVVTTRAVAADAGESPAICLRACYAMSGTGLGYAAICLRACYVMSGTDVAYADQAAMRCPVLP